MAEGAAETAEFIAPGEWLRLARTAPPRYARRCGSSAPVRASGRGRTAATGARKSVRGWLPAQATACNQKTGRRRATNPTPAASVSMAGGPPCPKFVLPSCGSRDSPSDHACPIQTWRSRDEHEFIQRRGGRGLARRAQASIVQLIAAAAGPGPGRSASTITHHRARVRLRTFPSGRGNRPGLCRSSATTHPRTVTGSKPCAVGRCAARRWSRRTPNSCWSSTWSTSCRQRGENHRPRNDRHCGRARRAPLSLPPRGQRAVKKRGTPFLPADAGSTPRPAGARCVRAGRRPDRRAGS